MSDMSWKDLRDLDCAAVRSIGESWKSYVPKMIEQTERLRNDVVGGHLNADNFDSDTATQVREHIDLSTGRFEDDLSDYANIRVSTTLLEAADALEAEQKELEEVVREIEDHDFVIEGDKDNYDVNFSGDLHQALWLTNPPEWLCHRIGIKKPEGIDAVDRLRALGNGIDLTFEASGVAKEYQDWLRAVMSRAHDADDDAAAALAAMRENPPELPPRLGATYDDLIGDYKTELSEEVAAEMEAIANGESDMSPEQVNQWWENLSDTEREALLTEHPEWVGPTDGIPVDTRDTANRTVLDNRIESLDDQIASIEQQMAEIDADYEAGRSNDSPVGYSELQEQLAELQQDREHLSDLDSRIQEPHSETGQEYFLLDFGTEGEGQAIVSVGNPDTAANVNVYVPGTGGTLGGAGYDDGGLLNRVDSMAFDAYEYGTAGQETATVLWLGYDAPDGVVDEARDTSFAEDAADNLSSFTDGLRSTAEGDPSNLTMTGHSYGSTTVGIAARDEGLDVDNMIFVGSPGVGVDNAESLGIDPENVWASRNPDDVIQFGMLHGEDPTSDDFGGNTFASEATAEGERPFQGNSYLNAAAGVIAAIDGSVENHSAYWSEGNVSRENMAFIVTGQESEVK